MRMFGASLRFMILADFPNAMKSQSLSDGVCVVAFAVNTELICLKCQFEIKAFANKRFGYGELCCIVWAQNRFRAQHMIGCPNTIDS